MKKRLIQWCKKQTNGKIPKIIDKVPQTTKMLLLNALYFDSKWKEPFINSIKKFFLILEKMIKRKLLI